MRCLGYARAPTSTPLPGTDAIAPINAAGDKVRPSIGLIEDDPVHRELVSAILARAGFDVGTYPAVLNFRRRHGAASHDLLLVDWELPRESGIEFLVSLRQSGELRLPVIFLTGRDDEAHVVQALAAGADDYLVKPANPAILVARVRAALRRAQPPGAGAPLDFAPFCILVSQRRLLRDGVEEKLTPREFDLLLYLFQRVGRIVSREALLSQVWKVGADVNTRAIDTYVSRLRKRLELMGENGWVLEGIYQHGYRLAKVESALPTT
jgi:DNA-binding response OmpR family regulator